MDNKYWEKRINNCSFAEFHDMKVESIRMITDGFKEPLVRLMISRGNVLSDQKAIYAIVKRAHSITKGRPFPSYFSSIELDLECGLLITAEPQTDAPKVETEPADDSLLMENQQLKADVKQLEEENTKLKIEKRKLKERLNGIEDYLNPSIDDTQGLTLKQKIVFFTSVTGVTLDKDYTHLSNFASFIALMCNEKNTSIGPMLSRIAKKDDNPQLQQTLHLAAQSVCDMLANTLTDATKNDKHQMINKIRENLRLDYPSPEDE